MLNVRRPSWKMSFLISWPFLFDSYNSKRYFQLFLLWALFTFRLFEFKISVHSRENVHVFSARGFFLFLFFSEKFWIANTKKGNGSVLLVLFCGLVCKPSERKHNSYWRLRKWIHVSCHWIPKWNLTTHCPNYPFNHVTLNSPWIDPQNFFLKFFFFRLRCCLWFFVWNVQKTQEELELDQLWKE